MNNAFYINLSDWHYNQENLVLRVEQKLAF